MSMLAILSNCPHCGKQPPLHRWKEFVAYQCCVHGDMNLSDAVARESWNDVVEATIDEAQEVLRHAGYIVTPPNAVAPWLPPVMTAEEAEAEKRRLLDRCAMTPFAGT